MLRFTNIHIWSAGFACTAALVSTVTVRSTSQRATAELGYQETSSIRNVRLFQDSNSFDLSIESRAIEGRQGMYEHVLRVRQTSGSRPAQFPMFPLGESTEPVSGPIRIQPILEPGRYQVATELHGVSVNHYRVLDITIEGEIREVFSLSLKAPPSFFDLNLDGVDEILEVVDTRKLESTDLSDGLPDSRWAYRVWRYDQSERRYGADGFLDPAKIASAKTDRQ